MAIDEPIVFDNLDSLISGISSLKDSDDWIYTDMDRLARDPRANKYYYLPEEWILSLPPGESYIDEEGLEMPEIVRGLGLRGWRLASDLALLASEVSGAEDVAASFVEGLQKWEDEQPNWRTR
ncbi:hypothetical protein [Mycobacterium camsae]|uniref:hypothetical protein n=1 Tax=Mycobacterium gordonae TaxID=1778 RepID=UPI00197E18ED|nr:hypothetical protein [Mycobacterium gordonae]